MQHNWHCASRRRPTADRLTSATMIAIPLWAFRKWDNTPLGCPKMVILAFLPLVLKAQRGIAIMVAVSRSGGRAGSGACRFSLFPFFFAMAFPIDTKICTRTNLTVAARFLIFVFVPEINAIAQNRQKSRRWVNSRMRLCAYVRNLENFLLALFKLL